MLTYQNIDWSLPSEHGYTLRDVVEGMGYDYGLDDYPIFDPDYRKTLNRAIIDHFWFRQIASDTPARFVFYLNRKMREIMPTYNAIYAKVREDGFDALADYSNSDTGSSDSESTGTNANKSSGASSVSNGGDTYTSDTPQQVLNDPTAITLANNLVRQSGTTDTNESRSDASTSDSSGHTAYVRRSTGYGGGLARGVVELISTRFMSTDRLVFSELEACFVQTYDDYND